MEGCLVASAVLERRLSTNSNVLSHRRVSTASLGLRHGSNQLLGRRVSLRHPFRVPSALFEDTFDDYDDDESVCLPRRITLNVSGLIFDTPLSMLARHPETLLGNPLKRRRFYDPHRDEYYFSRDPKCAEAIVEYYQTGRLRRPAKTPLDVFLCEVKFFEISVHTILRFCDEEGHERLRPKRPPRHPAQFRVWNFVMDPHSSRGALAYAAISLLLVIVSIVIFCLETLPMFHSAHGVLESEHYELVSDHNGTAGHAAESELRPASYDKFLKPMFLIETVCVAWFTVELLVHFTVCPDKKRFIGSALNIIDLLAVVPFYVHVGVSLVLIASAHEPDSHGFSLTVLHILHLVRVFRIFKLSQYSTGMRILGETFKTSFHELGLCLLFLGMGVMVFSSAVFYAELYHVPGLDKDASPGGNVHHFTSIPGSFYWAALTMTTVGYSSATPQTVIGKIVGSVCAISGLIAVSLPVPVIVANFAAIYQREKERHHVEEILTAAVGIQYTSTSSFHA